MSMTEYQMGRLSEGPFIIMKRTSPAENAKERTTWGARIRLGAQVATYDDKTYNMCKRCARRATEYPSSGIEGGKE
jgi:hypothetical protein